MEVKAVLHFDGSCWPNPGPNAKCGFVIKFEDGREIKKTVWIGEGTNNIAEYKGVIHGMQEALAASVTHLAVYGDSQLVIRGVSSMKASSTGKPHLEILKAEAQEIARKFASIEFKWVRREHNAEADSLSTAEPTKETP